MLSAGRQDDARGGGASLLPGPRREAEAAEPAAVPPWPGEAGRADGRLTRPPSSRALRRLPSQSRPPAAGPVDLEAGQPELLLRPVPRPGAAAAGACDRPHAAAPVPAGPEAQRGRRLLRSASREARAAVHALLRERTSVWVLALVAVDLGVAHVSCSPRPAALAAATQLGFAAATVAAPRLLGSAVRARLGLPGWAPEGVGVLLRVRLIVADPYGYAVALGCLAAVRPLVRWLDRRVEGDPPPCWRTHAAACAQALAIVGGRRAWSTLGPAALARPQAAAAATGLSPG